MSIPSIIYSTWKTKTNLPKKYRSYVKSVRSCNPNYKHIIYDDEDCRIFVKKYYPEYYNLYQGLDLPVQKADLWRYLIIYYYGGWYCDMDIYSYRSFDTVGNFGNGIDNKNKNNNKMVVELEFPAPLKYNLNNGNTQYAQYWFGATPKHPALKKVIKVVINNIKNKTKTKTKTDNETLYLTGPIPFTKSILKHQEVDPNSVYVLKPNYIDTLCQPLYFISSYISKYKNIPVVHRCEGTWKNNKSNLNLFLVLVLLLVVFILILNINF